LIAIALMRKMLVHRRGAEVAEATQRGTDFPASRLYKEKKFKRTIESED